VPETFVSEGEIFDGGVETQDLSASAVTPDKAALTASWFFEGGLTGSLQEAAPGIPFIQDDGTLTAITGASGEVILGVNTGVIPTLTGAVTFSGPVTFEDGLTGSLTQVASGIPFITGLGNVTVTTGANGEIFISSSAELVPGQSFFGIWAEENASLGAGAFEWAFGNGDDTPIGGGIVIPFACEAFALSLNCGTAGTAEVALYLNGAEAAAVSITAATASFTTLTQSIDIPAGGLINFRTKTGAGSSSGNRVAAWFRTTAGTLEAAPSDAKFLVLDPDTDLTEERVFVPSTGLTASDAGPGNNYTLAVDDSQVPFLSGAAFDGTVLFNQGLSGSLTQLTDGTSYLQAGTNVTITSGSNGSVTISSTGGGGDGDPNPPYLTLALTSSLTAERVLTVSGATGLTLDDGGPSGNATLAIDDSQVPFLSGATFSGVVGFPAGLSGSITRLSDGRSFLQAGTNVNITSESNGQIIIDAIDQPSADRDATYVVISLTGSLPNERALATSNGITLDDAGANGNVTIGFDDSVIATVSGITFTGVVVFEAGLTGSLTKLPDGTDYLVATSPFILATGSTGQVSLSGTFGTPSTLTPDAGNSEGTADAFARSDHIHDVPASGALDIRAGGTSTEGTAGSFARADHIHRIDDPSTQVTSTTLDSTTGTAFTDVAGMTITPGAGTYIVTFSAWGYHSNNNTELVIGIATGGTDITHTERRVGDTNQSDGISFSLHTQAKVTVGGAVAITGRFRREGGSGSVVVEERSLTVVRVDD
jgi:hypothetical protein